MAGLALSCKRDGGGSPGRSAYWLGEEYWGMGLATQAVAKMTQWSFNNLEIHKLIAPVLGPNKSSMRVLEKCDFELEGILRDEVCKEGTFYNVYYYSRIG
ncbi:MAG: GNAT family protein [Gemmatimonadales bacterium]